MYIYIYIYILYILMKVKAIHYFGPSTHPPPAKLDFSFSSNSLSSLYRKAALGRKFSCLALQQSVG